MTNSTISTNHFDTAWNLHEEQGRNTFHQHMIIFSDINQIDQALKLGVGAHVILSNNDGIKEGRANGTLFRVAHILKKTPDLSLICFSKRILGIIGNRVDCRWHLPD